ncbi:MAG TPA: hypothetical protein VFM18_08530 [Methanosarcina sp.]|nr:hypothetical protein [Methanosarcina sp.]
MEYNSSDSGSSYVEIAETTVLPVSALSEALFMVKESLSSSVSFQNNTSSQSKSEAARNIYYIAPNAAGDDDKAISETFKWPMAILNIREADWNLRSSGPNPVMAPTQSVFLYIEFKNEKQDHERSGDPALKFMNAIGSIIDDMNSGSQGDGGLQILHIRCEQPERNQESFLGTKGDFYSVDIILNIGYR